MFALNDLKFKKFAIYSISILLAYNSSIVLEYMGINILFLRQITGFLFLTFIPGYTSLRILKIHKIGGIKYVR